MIELHIVMVSHMLSAFNLYGHGQAVGALSRNTVVLPMTTNCQSICCIHFGATFSHMPSYEDWLFTQLHQRNWADAALLLQCLMNGIRKFRLSGHNIFFQKSSKDHPFHRLLLVLQA